MTYMELTCELQAPLRPEQLRTLGAFANTYGLLRIQIEGHGDRLRIEYDASRLTENQVIQVLRQAKIPVLRRVESPTAA